MLASRALNGEQQEHGQEGISCSAQMTLIQRIQVLQQNGGVQTLRCTAGCGVGTASENGGDGGGVNLGQRR